MHVAHANLFSGTLLGMSIAFWVAWQLQAENFVKNQTVHTSTAADADTSISFESKALPAETHFPITEVGESWQAELEWQRLQHAQENSLPPRETITPPEPLLAVPEAQPIQPDAATHEERRTIIESSVPDAQAEETEVWSDSLEGLTPAQIQELMRIRSQVSPDRGE